MRIGDRRVGDGDPVYLIAEIGVNHDGSIDRACALVEACASAGADAVKTQYFRTDRLMSRSAVLAAYQRSAGETDPIEMLRRLELSADDLRRFVSCAHDCNVHAIVTPFDVQGAVEMRGMSWDAFKTASPDVIHRPLLETIAADHRPMIVSTGASTMDEVRRAAGWLRDAVLQERVAFLHCVSCYPAPTAALEGLLAMMLCSRGATAKDVVARSFDSGRDRYVRNQSAMCDDGEFDIGVVGYSDHTSSIETMLDAAWVGAVMIEKHVTLDRSLPGPDHAASITPGELAAAVGRLREMRARCGRLPTAAEVCAKFGWNAADVCKRVLPCERDVRRVSRQSIVLTRAVCAGERLTEELVAYKRPGTGIEPFRLAGAIGRVFVEDVEADKPVPASALGMDTCDDIARNSAECGVAVGVGDFRSSNNSNDNSNGNGGGGM